MAQITFRLDPEIVNSTPNPIESRDNTILDLGVKDLPVLPKAERINLALKTWEETNGKLSLRETARIFGVPPSTLADRKMVPSQDTGLMRLCNI
jgi:hypothetical protein